MKMKLPKTRNCEFCGEKFYPASPRQKICGRIKCRRKLLAAQMRRYRLKRKLKKGVDIF